MVVYEWDVETVNSDGDIEDHNFGDKLKDLLGHLCKTSEQGCRKRLVLVRCTGDDDSGLTGRLWAYVGDGDFERGEFQDCGADGPIYPGVKIPKRFIEELDRLVIYRISRQDGETEEVTIDEAARLVANWTAGDGDNPDDIVDVVKDDLVAGVSFQTVSYLYRNRPLD